MAQGFRAYADSLGKPIDRVIITHAHPDHFLAVDVKR
jgi:glyoxylase-like metal-dependent hydrolase (beta-lactamase superfamily II)